MNERFEKMRRILEGQHDAKVRELFTSATNVVATPQEPLTLDKLQRLTADLRAKLGPTPMFLSSKLFPHDKAFTVEGPATKYTCAHPGFWARAQHEMRKDRVYESPTGLLPCFGVQIIEIDIEDDMSRERRDYLRGIWRDLIEAFKVAMTPLPEWLRPPPKFGVHG